MNWTSTTVPMWQIDCENYRRVWLDFELRDVSTPEQEAFVKAFAEKHGIKTERHGSTVRFLGNPKKVF